MSLKTIIEIGKTFRNQKDFKKAICHHSYANKFHNNDNQVILTIPVDSEMNFHFDKIITGCPENLRDELFYLTTRVSSNDTSASKYLFGDITYSLERTFIKKNNEKLKEKADEKGNLTLNYLDESNDKDTFLCQKAVELKLIALFGHKPQTKEEKDLWKELKPILNSRTSDNKERKLSKAAENKLKEEQLYAFWSAFCENFELIQNCMLYAPTITRNNINDTKSLIDEYQEFIFNKNKDEWDFLKDKKFVELTSDERNILKDYKKHSVFIHFAFLNKVEDIDEDDIKKGKHWYEQKQIFDFTIKTISSQAVINQTASGRQKLLVPSVSIFRTLCSGDEKNDIQFPDFLYEYSHKSFGFTDEQFEDFLYTGRIIRTPRRRIYNTNIELYVFPHNDKDKFNAETYSNFFFNKGSEINFLSDDPLNSEFEKFDFVFSDHSGQTIRDVIEVSGIEQSLYSTIRERIDSLENEVKQQIEKDTSFCRDIKIEKAFSDILGVPQKEDGRIVFKSKVKNKKGKEIPYPPYQYYLMKVMPKIYTETYYRDEALLTKVIEKVEYSVRNTNTEDGSRNNYRLLKYDLMLLMKTLIPQHYSLTLFISA